MQPAYLPLKFSGAEMLTKITLRDVGGTADLRLDAHYFELENAISPLSTGIAAGIRIAPPVFPEVKNGENLAAMAYVRDDEETDFSYISVGAISQYALRLSESAYLKPPGQHTYSPPLNQVACRRNEVLVTRSGTPGIAWPVEDLYTPNRLLIPSGFLIRVLCPTDRIIPSYLAAVLNHPAWRIWSAGLAAGKRQRNLSQEHLREIQVPLVEISRQRSIGDRYLSFLSELRIMLETDTSIIPVCDKVLQPVLETDIPRLVRQPLTFDAVTLQECANSAFVRIDARYHRSDIRQLAERACSFPGQPLGELVQWQVTKSPQPVILPVDEGISPRVVATSSIQSGQVIFDQTKQTTDDQFARSLHHQVRHGDLLFAMDGEGSIGKSAVFLDDYEAVCDSHVAILRPGTDTLALTLCCFLNSSLGQAQIERNISGSTGQTQLAIDDLLRIRVPVAVVENHRRVAAEFRAAMGSYVPPATAVKRAISSFSVALSQDLLAFGSFSTDAANFLSRLTTESEALKLLTRLRPEMF